jgi:hypothetical protein
MTKSTAEDSEDPPTTLLIIRLVGNVEFRYNIHKIRKMDFTSKPVE